MSYIYKITKDINQKIYIGKTQFSLEKRFKQHCKDAFKRGNEKRPLYSAIQKYGIEHFHIEEIEECLENEASEREKYWIEYFGTFKNGYNATKGGDGLSYLDYDLVVKTYEKIQNNKANSRIATISGHIRHVCNKKEKVLIRIIGNLFKFSIITLIICPVGRETRQMPAKHFYAGLNPALDSKSEDKG